MVLKTTCYYPYTCLPLHCQILPMFSRFMYFRKYLLAQIWLLVPSLHSANCKKRQPQTSSHPFFILIFSFSYQIRIYCIRQHLHVFPQLSFLSLQSSFWAYKWALEACLAAHSKAQTSGSTSCWCVFRMCYDQIA